MSQFEQWQFKPINDTFENECLTNAFYKSFTNTTTLDNASSKDNDNVFTDLLDSILNNDALLNTPPPVLTPTISTASENDVPAQKRRRLVPVPPTGKVSKRKSRASKRSTTTFITTDPANFRQMVQEVTGVRINGEKPVFKPEPQQPSFDSSSFLLDSGFLTNGGNNNSNNNYNNYCNYNSGMAQPTTTRNGGGGAVPGYGFDSFCSFPTLESWKV